MKSPIVVAGQNVINLNHLVSANPFEYQTVDEEAENINSGTIKTTKKVSVLIVHMDKGPDLMFLKTEDIQAFLLECSRKGFALS
jgi:hypothetical protein